MFKNFFSRISAFLQTPIGVIIAANGIWQVVMLAFKIPTNTVAYYIVSAIMLGFDVYVAFTLRDQLIYFFAQFVLPIQNQKYRQDIAARVRNFETGSRGPALFVKNGRVIMHEGEANKRGAGLIILDTASALVLRTDTEIKDTVGPGIKFTKGNEYIAGSVDLRSQLQFIGPLSAEKYLLKSTSASTSKDTNESQNQRQQTSGLTRDGFEVSPTISIKFSIKRPAKNMPTESGVTSRYGFDAEAVRNAITKQVIQLDASDTVRMEWNELPAHLVVNIWREYVRKLKLSDLFTAIAPNGASGLQIIEERINQRVKQAGTEALDDAGLQTGEWLESLEFKQLQSRGLEIKEVRIHDVCFEQSIEEKMIQQWSAEWLNIAQKEESYLKQKEALLETAAREEASKNFARIASQPFSGKPTQPQENPFITLQLLIEPLKKYLLNESAANSDMETELRKLDEIWKWLLDNNPNIPPTSPDNGGAQ